MSAASGLRQMLARGVHGLNGQRRREALELGRPVGDHGRGRDHQEWWQVGIRIACTEDRGNRLHGLTQPHVIGQDAAQGVVP